MAVTPTMSREQVGWRLLRDLNAEFVAIEGDSFWASVAVEDPATESEVLGVRHAASRFTRNRIEIIDANRVGDDEVRRILERADAVLGSVARTLQGHPLRRMIDLHYDVPVGIRAFKDRVNRYVFGYRLTVDEGGRHRVYRYRGVIHRKGVRWIGQSVLRLPPSIAEDVETQLRAWGIPVSREEVFELY